MGCENSPNKSLYKHALFVTWITILITLSLLLLLCEIKVHYFKFKFNPSKLARWLYTIVRCHLEEWWTKMDTGKVPNGQFFFCPSLSASENVNYSFWHETSTNYLPLGLFHTSGGEFRPSWPYLGGQSQLFLTYLSIYLNIFTIFGTIGTKISCIIVIIVNNSWRLLLLSTTPYPYPYHPPLPPTPTYPTSYQLPLPLLPLPTLYPLPFWGAANFHLPTNLPTVWLPTYV